MADVLAPSDAQILVVDDEDNITYLLGTALRHFGFGVLTAGSGREGLRPTPGPT